LLMMGKDWLVKMKVAVVCVMLAALMCFVFSGCNTIKGLGKDIQKAGEALDRAID